MTIFRMRRYQRQFHNYRIFRTITFCVDPVHNWPPFFSGKSLEPIWGSREFLKFIAIVNISTSISVFITTIFFVLRYMERFFPVHATFWLPWSLVRVRCWFEANHAWSRNYYSLCSEAACQVATFPFGFGVNSCKHFGNRIHIISAFYNFLALMQAGYICGSSKGNQKQIWRVIQVMSLLSRHFFRSFWDLLWIQFQLFVKKYVVEDLKFLMKKKSMF